ncbi:MAG: Spy/CpxP family protein refolding chaperone [Silvibacterium sp.]
MLLTKKKSPVLLLALASLLCFSTAAQSFAQDWHGQQQGMDRGGPMEHSFRGGEHGRWWDNPRMAQQIGLTDDQKKQMDDIFLRHRLQLIDLNATLQKDEILLRPMLGADQLDEAKVLSQIDAIAQARADLEKANARMLFGIRKVLTQDQWKKLQTIVHNHMAERGMGRGMGQGRDGWRGQRGNWRGPNGSKGPGSPNGGSNGQPAPPPPPDGQPNQ